MRPARQKNLLLGLMVASLLIVSGQGASAYRPQAQSKFSPPTQARHLKSHAVKADFLSTQGLFAAAENGAPIFADASRAQLNRSQAQRHQSKYSRATRLGRLMRVVSHRPKTITAEHAARLIQPGENVFMPVGHSVAHSVEKALVKRAQTGLDANNPVQIVGLANTASKRLFNDTGTKIIPSALFMGPNTREAVASGEGEFTPVFLHRVPRLIREGKIPVDTALIQVSTPDALGYVSLGASTAVTPAALAKAKTVIAEMSPNVPRTNGSARIHISQLDYVVKSEITLREMPAARIGDVEKKIAEYIVKGDGKIGPLVPNKPTLQFGIGGIPDAVAAELANSGRRDLRIKSEMISDGVMNLVEAGAVRGKVEYSFAMGSEKMIQWLDRNPKLRAGTTETINNPAKLGKVRRLVAINSALRVDLRGQINAQYVRDRWYSGVGGQVDFMRGAMTSKGGSAILALSATATIKDENGEKKVISRIVPKLGEGDVVTTSMHDVQYVVTEFGIADLDGKTADERQEALIEVAAPQFREGLRRELSSQREAMIAQQRVDATSR